MLASHFSNGMICFSFVSSRPYLISTYMHPSIRIVNADPKPYFYWGKEYNQFEQTSIDIEDFFRLIDQINLRTY